MNLENAPSLGSVLKSQFYYYYYYYYLIISYILPTLQLFSRSWFWWFRCLLILTLLIQVTSKIGKYPYLPRNGSGTNTLCYMNSSPLNSTKIFYWESCRSSATYDLWLKAESWSLNFKIQKKSFNNLRFNELQLNFGNSNFFVKLRYVKYILTNSRFRCKL